LCIDKEVLPKEELPEVEDYGNEISSGNVNTVQESDYPTEKS